MLKSAPYALALLSAVLLFGVANDRVTQLKRERIENEMQFAMPLVVQLAVTGGDRHLAANIGAFRAVTAGVFQLKPETYAILADVQRTAAELNPHHEDNYYTAAAILPWNGQVEAAQEVLRRATRARTGDALPPFFHGFNRYYFYSDFTGAAQDLMLAADRIGGNNRAALQAIAQKWFLRGENPQTAIDILRNMAKQSKDAGFRAMLEKRAGRLEGLVKLRDAADRYVQQTGRKPAKLEDLLSAKVIFALPVDPIGLGYTLDANGKPALVAPVQN